MLENSILYSIIGIVFLLILVLIAVRFGITKSTPVEEESGPDHPSIIHTSGIYSIVRKSPRESIDKHKPSEKEISQYLNSQNVDINGKHISEQDKEDIISFWNSSLENSIEEVEEGDIKGLEFYYYDFEENDPVCMNYIDKGHFITREDIYKYPELLPPFHLGCKCMLKCHHGVEHIKDTTELGMHPFIQNETLPPLPNWKSILKI